MSCIWHKTLSAQSAGVVDYTDSIFAKGQEPPNKSSGHDTKTSDGALGNVEYPFIAITPRSTLKASYLRGQTELIDV